MARNNRWSNHRLHRACARLSEVERRRSCGAFFGSIHATLNHILLIDRWYLGRLQARELAWTSHATELYAELAPLTRAQEDSDRELIALCDALGASDLERELETGAAGLRYRDPVHSVLAHLFLHQIHHRGQLHQMLSAAGAEPPQLDEFLLSGDAPLRKDELETLELEPRRP